MISLSELIEQGKTIGIIGGGQLGQMLTFAAKQAGMRVVILDPDPDCSAAQVADSSIVAEYSDKKAIEELARRSDVLTYEFENVDLEALEDVSDKVLIPQGTELLRITKDRLREKTFLKEHGLQVAPFAAVSCKEDFVSAIEEIGYPSVLKTCEGGYDGKSQLVLHTREDLKNADELLEQGRCILEGWVEFSMECSVMVARNMDGAISVFPVSENIHRNQILHESIVPARMSGELQSNAKKMAEKIANSLNLCGILGVEMFVGSDGRLYVNELAPRPHNSGHYSIEACNFSQFAVHNRAICNWPMPKIDLLSSVVMVNILGQHVDGCRKLVLKKPQWHFHDYGKGEIRIDRKMGHVTILTDDIEKTLAEVEDTSVWD
ncbi:phosphoribosylaminoimidazole carboxylase ATPase subunit [Ligilactobacillus ruminis DSM 20403 = NBRC 102161]|uniref:N5-carboxyaminoimidazole ribonucleotide synthase n=1 Tax=Ligilactobacillus ruminis DSM 20403 = NBRC 102161 TaxID=1423798 RepID=A0A1I2S338_9LACO|nr:phosphoribosylaminoimidazole carboxylase ATPase subunit [Ligilactobacillus ruminis DSM 20403 = NBRC 102161]SFG47345.1 5-(carboxyamino)imidazole ribonucleotide synthase [Ligilactobacillus ruminis DSM 20403 = NBRC 102161]